MAEEMNDLITVSELARELKMSPESLLALLKAANVPCMRVPKTKGKPAEILVSKTVALKALSEGVLQNPMKRRGRKWSWFGLQRTSFLLRMNQSSVLDFLEKVARKDRWQVGCICYRLARLIEENYTFPNLKAAQRETYLAHMRPHFCLLVKTLQDWHLLNDEPEQERLVSQIELNEPKTDFNLAQVRYILTVSEAIPCSIGTKENADIFQEVEDGQGVEEAQGWEEDQGGREVQERGEQYMGEPFNKKINKSSVDFTKTLQITLTQMTQENPSVRLRSRCFIVIYRVTKQEWEGRLHFKAVSTVFESFARYAKARGSRQLVFVQIVSGPLKLDPNTYHYVAFVEYTELFELNSIKSFDLVFFPPAQN
eukprot:TRINITY_DN2515_c1_g1_i7.p1 TRINITY_DN2515_c1_g1~~TRINITY_DN2515_c1_g1_i7.p1  ORF type:complete len:368 (+),score=14.61 TRINITY_DN2515_c1_g1_i7:313-1416(+)